MGRKHSSSGGSYKEIMFKSSSSNNKRLSSSIGSNIMASSLSEEKKQQRGSAAEEVAAAIDEVHALLQNLMQWRDSKGKTLLHYNDLTFNSAFLKRLRQLASLSKENELGSAAAAAAAAAATSNAASADVHSKVFQLHRDYLTVRDVESGYTPLHWAVYRRDLAATLLILRHAYGDPGEEDAAEYKVVMTRSSSLLPPRLKQRPIDLLLLGSSRSDHRAPSDSSSSILAVSQATDHERMTPADLLLNNSRNDLLACRLLALPRPKLRLSSGGGNELPGQRRVSFDDADNLRGDDEQNEFDLLSRALQRLRLPQQQDQGAEAREEGQGSEEGEEASVTSQSTANSAYSYACEVLTFGRAHHCALGDESSVASQSARPSRVQAFALGETRFRESGSGPAIAVAAAAHHTLIATAKGHVYAFGMGKGGRLGCGNEQDLPLPTRVFGALQSRRVVAVAAAENHSLCVTDDGDCWGWGSNRFGQIISSKDGDASCTRCLPRRIDDLKNVFCVAVAVGAKHSVALSRRGEVFVWGDNSNGQLGIARRNHNNGHGHKAQRVEALWGQSSPAPKVAISIAASAFSTLVLTIPNAASGSLPVNSIYAWGHGSHVPTKVHFEGERRNNNSNSNNLQQQRTINPVAIACAKYHNVVVTTDGRVWTWGLHAEPLGNPQNKKKSVSSGSFQASLVTGMLPENGGGIAVSVSASENHTAVITDDGALYTWGATKRKSIMGHEGVRWQPVPRRVHQVTRAVGVAASKEHTVLLVATTFPPLPPTNSAPSLELLAARKAAEHVDLFNVLPCLITAERTDCIGLINYCRDLLQRNLDGVLTVAEITALNCYLDEQLISCSLPQPTSNDEDTEKLGRDQSHHPLFLDCLLAGTHSLTFDRDPFSNTRGWLSACQVVASSTGAKVLASCCSYNQASEIGKRSMSYSEANLMCSNRALVELTADIMDLNNLELAEAKKVSLAKEIRGVRKRLNQISKLLQSCGSDDVSAVELSSAEREKIARRPQLEADLPVFEQALERVQKRLEELGLLEEKERKNHDHTKKERENHEHINKKSDPVDALKKNVFRCSICQITCPDETSYALHLNGRKHRNCLAQVEEQEKKSVAISIMAEKQAKNLMGEVNKHPVKLAPGPWQKGSTNLTSSPLQPLPYSLPLPPIPPPDSIVTKPKKPVSLREIMKEESINKKGLRSGTPRVRTRASIPVAVGVTTEASHASLSLKPPPPQSEARPSLSPRSPALLLPEGSAPPLKSPPWASAPIAFTTPERQAYPAKLGVFLSPAAPESNKRPPQPSRMGAWSTSGFAPMRSASQGPTLRDIQQEEKELKSKQDHSVHEDGKWYVERRERAASFKDIQTQDGKEREERLFLEEQYMIEKQIEEERAAADAANMKAKKQRSSRRKSKSGQRKRGKKNAPTIDKP